MQFQTAKKIHDLVYDASHGDEDSYNRLAMLRMCADNGNDDCADAIDVARRMLLKMGEKSYVIGDAGDGRQAPRSNQNTGNTTPQGSYPVANNPPLGFQGGSNTIYYPSGYAPPLPQAGVYQPSGNYYPQPSPYYDPYAGYYDPYAGYYDPYAAYGYSYPPPNPYYDPYAGYGGYGYPTQPTQPTRPTPTVVRDHRTH